MNVNEDHSAYWVPSLYFHDKTQGTYEKVNASIATYWLQRGTSNGNTTGSFQAYPPNFRMIAGNPMQRTVNSTDDNVNMGQQLSWACISYDGSKPTDTYKPYGPGFPSGKCGQTFRAEMFFPNCCK